MNFKYYNEIIDKIVALKQQGIGSRQIAKQLNIGKSTVNQYYRYFLESNKIINDEVKDGPKILVLDIETAPISGFVWRLWKQNVGLNQIQTDWYLMSFAAKWLGSSEDEIIYMDSRNNKDPEDDSEMLKTLWGLLDQADWVVHQNGRRFDVPKIRARMVLNKMKPFSPVRHIDTLEIAKRCFGFTSNKLEYMTDKLCVKYKKQKHNKFAGFELWSECMKGNVEAWEEMETYNKFDILSLEELYFVLVPWYDKLPNPNLYSDSLKIKCICGSTKLKEHGFATTDVSKFKQYVCEDCGKHYRGRKNLLTKEKRESILTNVREN